MVLIDKLKQIKIYNKIFIEGDLVEVFTEEDIIKCHIKEIRNDFILIKKIVDKFVIDIRLEDIKDIF